MKIRRIASSIALAAAVALGATGCSLFAPQGTLEQYAPSDGINVNLEGVDVRNILLVEDESGENFNVVFTAVNQGSESVLLRLTFVSEDGGSTASADFDLEPGTNIFGHPDGEIAPTLVSIPGLAAGATINTYFEVAGGEANYEVPVLDGTLVEYRDYVISASQLAELTETGDETAEDGTEATDGAASTTESADDESAE